MQCPINQVLLNNWPKSNALRYIHSYALKWYEDCHIKTHLRGKISESLFCVTLEWIVYDYFHPPLLSLNYQSWKNPTVLWMSFLALRLVSVFLSAYSTFNPIIDNLKMTSFRRLLLPPSLLEGFIKILQILLYIIIGSAVVFLPRSLNIHNI